MTQNATPHQPTGRPEPKAADTARDVPAVITLAETLAELADLVHRHRLAIAHLRQRLAELSDERAVRQAQAVLAVEGANAEQRRAAVTLALAVDADFQALRRKERDLKRELAERQADIERAQWRLRVTLSLLPTAQAVDALAGGSEAGDGEETDAAPTP